MCLIAHDSANTSASYKYVPFLEVLLRPKSHVSSTSKMDFEMYPESAAGADSHPDCETGTRPNPGKELRPDPGDDSKPDRGPIHWLSSNKMISMVMGYVGNDSRALSIFTRDRQSRRWLMRQSIRISDSWFGTPHPLLRLTLSMRLLLPRGKEVCLLSLSSEQYCARSPSY